MKPTDNNQKEDKPKTLDDLIQTPTQAHPALKLDVDFYQSFLDDTDIPEDKKREFIEALWSIITAFVDLGFGIHPVQQAMSQKSGSMPEIITDFVNELDQQGTETKPEERTDA